MARIHRSRAGKIGYLPTIKTFSFGVILRREIMRTLLRHTETGRYLHSPNKWTKDVEEAYDFLFIDHALHYVETWRLKKVELAFAFDDPAWITTVPLERSSLRYAAA